MINNTFNYSPKAHPTLHKYLSARIKLLKQKNKEITPISIDLRPKLKQSEAICACLALLAHLRHPVTVMGRGAEPKCLGSNSGLMPNLPSKNVKLVDLLRFLRFLKF